MYSRSALKSFLTATKVKMLGTRYFLNDEYDLSEKFEGDALVFAENYRMCLKIESTEHGITYNTEANARSRLVQKLTTPMVRVVTNPCGRCNGTGYVPFRHIENGICFKCGGTGKNK